MDFNLYNQTKVIQHGHRRRHAGYSFAEEVGHRHSTVELCLFFYTRRLQDMRALPPVA